MGTQHFLDAKFFLTHHFFGTNIFCSSLRSWAPQQYIEGCRENFTLSFLVAKQLYIQFCLCVCVSVPPKFLSQIESKNVILRRRSSRWISLSKCRYDTNKGRQS